MGAEQQGSEITVASERIYTGRVVNLRVDTVAVRSGKYYKREIVEHRGAVAIAAIDDDGQVLLVRQYRKAAGGQLLELPAGTLEQGEDPERCAIRELEEETGYRADAWTHLAGFYSSPGFCTEFMHLYLAQGLKLGVAAQEPDEQIELVKLPLQDALVAVKKGEISDAKSITGLLMARDQLVEDRAKSGRGQ